MNVRFILLFCHFFVYVSSFTVLAVKCGYYICNVRYLTYACAVLKNETFEWNWNG